MDGETRCSRIRRILFKNFSRAARSLDPGPVLHPARAFRRRRAYTAPAGVARKRSLYPFDPDRRRPYAASAAARVCRLSGVRGTCVRVPAAPSIRIALYPPSPPLPGY